MTRTEIGYRVNSRSAGRNIPGVRREEILAIRGGKKHASKRPPSLPKLKCLDPSTENPSTRETK